MPSASNVFLAGVLLGTGASLGGGALLDPSGVRANAEADAPPLEGLTSAGAAYDEAREALAGMGTRAPRARAGRGPSSGRARAGACWRIQKAALDDEWDGEVEETEQVHETDEICRPLLPRFERVFAPGADGEDTGSRACREASLWYAVAMVRALTGDVAATMAALEKAAALQPNAEHIVNVLSQLGPDELAPGIARLLEKVPGALARVKPLIVALLSAEPPKTDAAFALGAQALDRPRDGVDDRMDAAHLLLGADAERTDALLVPRARSFSRKELFVLARCFVNVGEKGIAAAWWKRLCARPASPGDDEFDLSSLRREVDPDAEIEDLREQVRKYPDDALLWTTLAAQLTQAGDRKGAFEAVLEALRIQPDDEDLVAQLLDLDAAAAVPVLDRLPRRPMSLALLHVLGMGFARNGMIKESGDAFFQAQERNPENRIFLEIMVALDPARALLRLTEMTAKPTWQNDAGMLGAQANALLACGDRPSAFRVYAHALEIDPQDGDWLVGLADADPARAIPLLEAQRARQPNNADAAGALAAAYAETGRVTEAVALFEEAIGSEDTGQWPMRYAKIAPERALEFAVDTATRYPQSVDAWVALGDVYRQLGRIPEARAAYEKGQQERGREAEIAVRLAKLK